MKRIPLLALIIMILGCSKDQNNTEISLMKFWTHVDLNFSYLDEFFYYEGEYLTDKYSGDGYRIEYRYDKKGNLSEAISSETNYVFYSYDNNNRLTEVLNENKSTRYTLSYDSNKVYVSSYSNGNISKTYEHILDNKGQIIEINLIFDKYSNGSTSPRREYYYDDRGNIVNKIIHYNNGTLTINYNYEYDNNPYPFYYAYKKLYRSTYHIICFDDIPNHPIWGITPNNITSSGDERKRTHKFEYNEKGYPIYIYDTYYNGIGYSTSETTVGYH